MVGFVSAFVIYCTPGFVGDLLHAPGTSRTHQQGVVPKSFRNLFPRLAHSVRRRHHQREVSGTCESEMSRALRGTLAAFIDLGVSGRPVTEPEDSRNDLSALPTRLLGRSGCPEPTGLNDPGPPATEFIANVGPLRFRRPRPSVGRAQVVRCSR
ncbi:hypothetical protein HNY73_017747 [Argiope bruennichi]|uniref:Uncharacterized protein n=1 Tax=Argiope bruennichi TaxID=94029 RepID=A0A8T0EDU2_ARGBR|nr:hypothetical protein HNY73_017747 [Argiope bruennichi]